MKSPFLWVSWQLFFFFTINSWSFSPGTSFHLSLKIWVFPRCSAVCVSRYSPWRGLEIFLHFKLFELILQPLLQGPVPLKSSSASSYPPGTLAWSFWHASGMPVGICSGLIHVAQKTKELHTAKLDQKGWWSLQDKCLPVPSDLSWSSMGWSCQSPEVETSSIKLCIVSHFPTTGTACKILNSLS